MNVRKRLEYSRKLMTVLNDVLNDSSIMPNIDCSDLVISISNIEFGKTVRDITVELFGEWKSSGLATEKHEEYITAANKKVKGSYIDLGDVTSDSCLTYMVAEEIKRKLKLQYVPNLKFVSSYSRLFT